jgi:hypothetical protein
MSVPTGAPSTHGTTREDRGRRLGIWSLLMVPALLLSLVASSVVGYAIMQALDLADSETLYSAGAVGYVAALLVTLLILVPQAVGIWLALRARRLGATGLGTVGLVVNAVIAGFWLLALVAGAVGA